MFQSYHVCQVNVSSSVAVLVWENHKLFGVGTTANYIQREILHSTGHGTTLMNVFLNKLSPSIQQHWDVELGELQEQQTMVTTLLSSQIQSCHFESPYIC